ncbi:NACHT, LRR and PYD domains-containing protein 1b allele 3 isoform X3 [Acipenser ruthenus]|uniref:NACHT, LRR and PYD domains-containing protein 1b allele 3 isoform X3 n=1 Tax=Acipenser ruthenus TaxID=7906 RepID=UPI00145B1CFD|nr:NACHT, LRR and PYD domains-containing protein 1b allele 3 isoform X3 [Acipenser ruthenus]XP_033894246.1 NACHT, LRR and PYD domains-containing protein 1b allele 3 isoform X3 [Acipenser ruthenus]
MEKNQSYEQVTPRNISKGRLLLILDNEGSYQCSVTGLMFEVSDKVKITYATLSWSKYGTYLKEPWKFVGPIFDVKCDPTILKAIHFPHSLCLGDHESDMKFGVLHIKDNAPVIESSSDHSTSHIKWNVTSLSPVGPIVQTSQRIEHHGVVLVYKVLDNHPSASFRVYLATNNNSDVKDIYKDVKQSNKKYIKIDKPPTCLKLLEEKKKYRLISEPEADITPEEIQFTLHAVRFKGYFEVYFEQPVPFKLSLVEADSDLTVWTTTLRECDWNTSNFKETAVKRAENGFKRKRSSSSEEENDNKKFKCADTTDGSRSSKKSYITEQQLMRIAKVFGKEWKQLGISYLNISKNDIDQIQEEDKEDLAMQKFNMLLEWKKKAKDNATIKYLYYSLHDPDVPYVVKKLLQDMVNEMEEEPVSGAL